MNLKLFKDILEIDSTSGKERTLALWLYEHLDAPSKQLMEVGDGTLNLLLTWPKSGSAPTVPKERTEGAKSAIFDAPVQNLGTEGAPKVVFCTHMDTVPPYIEPTFLQALNGVIKAPAGARPYPGLCASKVVEGAKAAGDSRGQSPLQATVTGRGSCDAKGQLLAMYTACKQLEADGYSDFGLLLLAGEETGSWGAKAFSKTGFTAPFLIVGEPTDNKMVSAAKGTLSYDLKFTGEPFHSGYPQYGISAIELFNEFYNKLKAVDWGTDPELGETTWNIGLLHSDNPQNILSGELTCRLYFRTTFMSHEAVQTWMEIAGQAGNDVTSSGNDVPVMPDLIGHLAVTPRGGDIPARYVVLNGFESAPVAFGSDAPHLTGFGHKIICGPGSIKVAHRPEENIKISDLEAAVKLYVKMAVELIGCKS